MIVSFRHKGLELFFREGSLKGIQAKHQARLRRLLIALDTATLPEDMALPGSGLHALSGDLVDHWSVKVSGNWRVTFRFIGQDVELVNYLDYH